MGMYWEFQLPPTIVFMGLTNLHITGGAPQTPPCGLFSSWLQVVCQVFGSSTPAHFHIPGIRVSMYVHVCLVAHMRVFSRNGAETDGTPWKNPMSDVDFSKIRHVIRIFPLLFPSRYRTFPIARVLKMLSLHIETRPAVQLQIEWNASVGWWFQKAPLSQTTEARRWL